MPRLVPREAGHFQSADDEADAPIEATRPHGNDRRAAVDRQIKQDGFQLYSPLGKSELTVSDRKSVV